MTFSILIPSWNNLPYLQSCIESIWKNSAFPHQIIVIVNEGKDDTLKWLIANNLSYIHHQQNVGICSGLNSSFGLIKNEFAVYLNDDMLVLPQWDTALIAVIEEISHREFILSGTMIEPRDSGNVCALVADFGDDLSSLNWDGLMAFHRNKATQKQDWNGATWPPILLPTSLWKAVGGMSEEFSPGMYSDPDLSMKLWQYGVRYFRGVGNSQVYHFGSKSTRKLGKNIGRQIFLKKWGVTARFFYKNYLKMGTPFTGPLPNYNPTILDKVLHFLKRIKG